MSPFDFRWRRAWAAILVLGGCAGRLPSATAEVRSTPVPVPVRQAGAFRVAPGDVLEFWYSRKYDGIDGEYLLDVGDVLSITLDEHPEASGEVVVRPDGRVTVPLVGDIPVRGESLAAVTQRMREGLGRRVVSPSLIVKIVKPQARVDQFFDTLASSGGVVRTMLVRPDGRLSFPLVGEVTVAGRTVAEVEAELGERFGRLFRYVDVTMNLKSSPRQRIAVLGEVRRPGLYPLDGALTLLQAVALAGGFLETAAEDDLVVARWESPTELASRKAVDAPARDGERVVLLEAEDIVFVPRSGISNVNLFVQQYIRQVLPFNTSVGAFYNLNDEQRQ